MQRPSPAGAVCGVPGVNRRPGRLPDCLAGMGVGGGAAHARSRQLGTPMGVWILFWTGWFSPVGRSDSWACRLGSGARESPRCEIQKPRVGVSRWRGSAIRDTLASTGKVRQKRKPRLRPPGRRWEVALLAADTNGISDNNSDENNSDCLPRLRSVSHCSKYFTCDLT